MIDNLSKEEMDKIEKELIRPISQPATDETMKARILKFCEHAQTFVSNFHHLPFARKCGVTDERCRELEKIAKENGVNFWRVFYHYIKNDNFLISPGDDEANYDNREYKEEEKKIETELEQQLYNIKTKTGYRDYIEQPSLGRSIQDRQE